MDRNQFTRTVDNFCDEARSARSENRSLNLDLRVMGLGEGGGSGARGQLLLDGQDEGQPKALLTLQPDQRIQLNLPGGGGFGTPLERDPELVLADVVEGYVSIEGAERDYGVVVRYTGSTEQMVRLPEDYQLDREATERLRSERRGSL